MKATALFFSSILLLAILSWSCEDTGVQGNFNENQPPNTSMTVDEVDRSGDDRLISQIRLSWWGDDPDGYVTGFEYRINESDAWAFTSRNDSLFVLPIPEGQDSADVRFEIRAIDNNGLSDPTPANLSLPIKNSIPTVRFRDLETPPDTTYNLFGFGWDAVDPDGASNLRYTELAFNDSLDSWLRIPVTEDILHFEMDESGNAQIFFGSTYRSTEFTIDGLVPDAMNTIYVRVVDQALRTSEMIRFDWYVKTQQSRSLILFDDDSNDADALLQSYLVELEQLGYSFDIWDISDGDPNTTISDALPETTEPTLLKTLAEWDHILWITNDIERNMRFAQDITREFFSNGGRILTTGPSKRLIANDPLLNFIPIASYGELTGFQTGFQINNNTEVTPVASSNAPTLTTRRRMNNITPFLPASGSTSLYQSNFLANTILGFTQPFDGANNVAVKNPEGNFVFFGFEPADVAQGETLRQLFNYLLSEELNIQP